MASASSSFAAALERDAVDLVDHTPDISQMEGYSEQIRSEYLKGLKLSIETANLEDSEEFVKDLMGNVAQAEGIRATVSDIDLWSTLTYEELAGRTDSNGKSLAAFSNSTAVSTAQAGLDVASKTYGESYSIYNLTANVLEDGNLSVMEAVKLGSTAVSCASTMLAGFSGGASLGPVGAVAGLILSGISYLSTSASAQAEYQAARVAALKESYEREAKALDSWNAIQKQMFEQRQGIVWSAKDSSIAEVADNWAAFEEDLGVRFALRYFPGSMVPQRGGIYKQVSNYYVKNEVIINGTVRNYQCESLSGCLYFPEPTLARVQAVGYEEAFLEMVDRLAKKGSYLFDPKYSIEDQYVLQEPAFNPYYDRTLRVFDSYLKSGEFWTPPNRRIGVTLVKDFRDHLYEATCGQVATSGPCIDGRVAKHCDNLAFSRGECSFDNKLREGAFDNLAVLKSRGSKYADQFLEDTYRNAQRFWDDLNEDLSREQTATNIFKTRITGDLVQTANAVGGEMATALRLKTMLDDMGTTDVRMLSQSEKRSFSAVSSEEMAKISKTQQRDGLLNNAMLLAGSSALGYSAWKKWG